MEYIFTDRKTIVKETFPIGQLSRTGSSSNILILQVLASSRDDMEVGQRRALSGRLLELLK